MAVRYLQIPLDLANSTGEFDDPSDAVSGAHFDGSPEINVGAFRGLAFALIFETVLVILGSLAWQIIHTLR
ncbi:MAG TPA: hypothetical protein VGF88_11400 [Acidobacteriaceae bacterium]|jgi:hypothetical protein